MTIIALTCFLVVGAAAASILGRDSVPPVRPGIGMVSAVVRGPVSNREGKTDRLAVVALEPASPEPPQKNPEQGEPLRLSFADSKALAYSDGPKLPDPVVATSVLPKPKMATRPPAQRSYALLSDAQIAGIKERLKLSSSQESYWPAVESALRAVARKIHATRQADPKAGVVIDPDAEEVQQLKSAAMPLLFQLREDQKREVRSLARLIGLEKIAALI
jgi:hypothetical protein